MAERSCLGAEWNSAWGFRDGSDCRDGSDSSGCARRSRLASMGGGICVESCRDGPRAICRILQAIVAGILLFTGITCQFWSGMNVNDVPLSKLCNTFSGSGETSDGARILF